MSDGNIAIRVSNLSKCYHIYDSPRDRLKQTLFSGRNYYREFWALRDVSFEVRKGEAVGIIGRNGSGKSTLLQLITGTLKPTAGQIEVSGRVAALLELGSGFNPEFTGRENVYLNGVLLGLTNEQIDQRFDAIADFADIGDFIDQPVKTYSSGMLVRLAFAVQVQIEPDILIVDEALAVGDALFQKYCFQKIEKLVSNGTSLLFVSHDQEAVRTLTHHAMLLTRGQVKSTGTSAEVLLEYRRQLHEEEAAHFSKINQDLSAKATAQIAPAAFRSDRLSFGDGDAEVASVAVFNDKGEPCNVFHPLDSVRVRVECLLKINVDHLNIGLRLRNKEGVKVYSWGTLNQDISIRNGLAQGELFWEKTFQAGTRVVVDFDFVCCLGTNLYEIQAAVTQEGKPYYGEQRMLHWRDEAAFFHVIVKEREYFFGGAFDMRMQARF
ncbi:MAG TPA: ABC transporter ATP-binding protein [Tepidisphaeraceae bacterium]|nr:ABC transporter ATP-binding protein [Tepidisphaeraceae bacterium]